MSDLEKIIFCISLIDSMLTNDFMTDPVRETLTNIKTNLTAVRDSLTN